MSSGKGMTASKQLVDKAWSGERRSLAARVFRSHDFIRDIVVTTLGVLIALGIGEIVEEVRWKFRIAATDEAMREEAGLLHTVYIERQMLEPCIARRLTELGEVLHDARVSGRLPLIRNISAPPNRADYGDSWQVMLGTEIPLHIEPRKLMATATLWVNEDAYSDMVDRQRDAFDRLGMIENRAGPVSENTLAQVEVQLTEATIASDTTYHIAQQDAGLLRENKIPALYRPDTPLNQTLLRQESRRRYLCQPLEVDGKPYRLKNSPRKPRQSLMPAKTA